MVNLPVFAAGGDPLGVVIQAQDALLSNANAAVGATVYPGDALATERDKNGKCPRLFVQVNTGEEPQKAGAMPAEAVTLIAYARKLELPLVGLMCIPPALDDVAPHFAFLAKLAKENDLSELSMGMSGDFEMAVRFGATLVRVGSAIFGIRAKT